MPPYGKLIRTRRDRGDHPTAVFVYFTQHWHKPPDAERCNVVMVPPDEYEPGKYDFSVLAGLWVVLVTESTGLGAGPIVVMPRCLQLAIEIAREAAPVYLAPELRDAFNPRELSELLLCYKEQPRPDQPFQWPAGWSDELNEDYRQRENLLLNFYERRLEASA